MNGQQTGTRIGIGGQFDWAELAESCFHLWFVFFLPLVVFFLVLGIWQQWRIAKYSRGDKGSLVQEVQSAQHPRVVPNAFDKDRPRGCCLDGKVRPQDVGGRKDQLAKGEYSREADSGMQNCDSCG